MGNICLDFVADYLSPSAKYRSGYGSLGIKGGGGMVYKGNAAHVKSVESSLARNLNRQTRYSTSTSDSPREGTVGWEDEQTYTVVISKDACSRYGFGGVKVPKVKNYRSKRQNCESHVAHPASSTVTNKATATASWNGSTVKATDTATVVVDASSRNWSQCSKY
jgi:hypothetical protein